MTLLIATVLLSFLTVGSAAGQADYPANVAIAPQAMSTNTFTGRCHCGFITYEADRTGAKSDDCSCRGCQRASGSLTTQYIIVQPKAVRILTGSPADFRAHTGVECDAWGVWQFCPQCGAPLFWRANDGHQVDIFAGTLDDPSVYTPKE